MNKKIAPPTAEEELICEVIKRGKKTGTPKNRIIADAKAMGETIGIKPERVDELLELMALLVSCSEAGLENLTTDFTRKFTGR